MTWRPPEPVIPPGTAKIARFAVLASDASQTFLMGNNIPFYDGRPVPPHALTVWSWAAGDVGRPQGDFVFAYPRGVIRDGVLYVLWGEPEASANTTDAYSWPGELTSIWSASYSQRTGWSKPERLFVGPVRMSQSLSPSVSDVSAAPTLTAGVTPNGLSNSILTFTLTANGWEVYLIPVGQVGSYPSVVQTGSSQIAAFVAAADDGRADVNSVFVVRSSDNGRTWLPRLLLSRSGKHPAHDTQLLVDRNRQIHLVWRQDLDKSTVLHHMMSPDGGRAWTTVQDLALPSSGGNLRAAVDGCGRVHAFYRDYRANWGRPHLGHAVWQGTWMPPEPELDSLAITDHAVHATSDGTLLLVVTVIDGQRNDDVVSGYRTISLRSRR